jgi:hypothetical protein
MKSLRIFFSTVLTVMMLAYTTPSQAVVGKIIHHKKVVTVGLALTGSGVAIAAGGAAIVNATCVDLGCLAVLIPIFAGGVVSIAGLITLDGEQAMQFSSLTSAQGAKMGVSESERAIYNNELDQANLILSQVSEEVSALQDAQVSDSVRLWEEVKDLVSPETFGVMQKIVLQK